MGINTRIATRVLLLRFLKGPGRAYDEDGAIAATGLPHLIDQVRTGRAEFFGRMRLRVLTGSPTRLGCG